MKWEGKGGEWINDSGSRSTADASGVWILELAELEDSTILESEESAETAVGYILEEEGANEIGVFLPVCGSGDRRFLLRLLLLPFCLWVVRV